MSTHTIDTSMAEHRAESSAIPGPSSLVKTRVDASKQLRLTHEAAGHDQWFREQVDLAIKEADASDAQWVSKADAKASWKQKRAELVQRAGGAA